MSACSLPPCAERDVQVFAFEKAGRRDAGGMANLFEPRLVNAILGLATNTKKVELHTGEAYCTAPKQYEISMFSFDQNFAYPMDSTTRHCALCRCRSHYFYDAYDVRNPNPVVRRELSHCYRCGHRFCEQCSSMTQPACPQCNTFIDQRLACKFCLPWIFPSICWTCYDKNKRRELLNALPPPGSKRPHTRSQDRKLRPRKA